MSSNITGSNNITDLLALVSNLQNSVNAVSGSITNINSNISNLQQYDQQATTKFNQNTIVDNNQTEYIQNLENVDILTNQQIQLLNSKFPITNSSIVDNTISKVKIAGLQTDLNDFNTRINTNQNNITSLNTKVDDHKIELDNDINNLSTKQQTDHDQVYDEIHTLLASQPGTTTNTFQVQIDNLNSNLNTEKNKITTNTNNISQNTASITLNNSKITALESDNVINKATIAQHTTQISNHNTSITTLNTNYNNLNSNLTLLTNTENTNHINQQNLITSLQTNLTSLDTRESGHYNDLNTRLNNLQSSNTTDLTALENALELLDTRESTNNTSQQTLINDLDSRETLRHNLTTTSITNLQNELDILENKQQSDYDSNLTKINTNTSDITNIKPRLTTAENTLLTHSTNINTNSNDIDTLEQYRNIDRTDIDSLQTDNNTNKLTLQNHTTQIQNLQLYDTNNTTNITNLQNKSNNNETEINTLKNTTIPNLNNKFLIKDSINGDSFLGTLKINSIDVLNNGDNLLIGENSNMIFLGSANNTDNKTINIGGVNDTVNIKGTTNYIQVNNVEIQDKTIVLNKGSIGENTSAGISINFRDNNLDDKGYVRINENMNQLLVKLPQNETIYKIGEVNDFNSLTTKLYVDLQNSNLQAQVSSNQQDITNNSNQITTINNQLLEDIPFSKIANYPSNNGQSVLDDTGDFVKIQNKHINNNSISTLKLQGVDNLLVQDKFLNIDGSFKTITGGTGFNNQFSDDVNGNNHQINNIANGILSNDVVNKGQVDSQINNLNSNLTSYVDNKYLNQIDVSLIQSQPLEGQLGQTPPPLPQFNISCNVNMNNKIIKNIADPINFYDVAHKGYVDNKIITNSNLLDHSIALVKLIGTNGDGNSVLLNDGSTRAVGNNQIFDNSISATKLMGVSNTNDGLSYLNNKGEFVVVSGGGGSSFDYNLYQSLNANGYKITNLGQPTDDFDVSTKLYVDNKYFNAISTTVSFSNQEPGFIGMPQEIKTFNIFENVDMNNKNIKNLNNPTNNQDAVNLQYFNNNVYNTYNNGRIKGEVNTNSFINTGIIIDAPLKLVLQLKETLTTGYNVPGSYYTEVMICSNNAISWTDRRYIFYGGPSSNNNNLFSQFVYDGNTYVGGLGSYLINGSYTSGTNVMAQILYGVLYLRLYDENYKYKYYIAYQF